MTAEPNVPREQAPTGQSDTPVIPLHVSSSAHIVAPESVTHIMLWVVGALVPVALYAIWLMGWAAASIIAVCIVSAVGTEWVWNAAFRKPQTIRDGSALVTGLLLAFCLPPHTPLWIAFIGGVVAIALAKMLFGGLGWNQFNPALVGRAVVLLSWLGVMSRVKPYPGGWFAVMPDASGAGVDTISGATRLAIASADRAANGAYNFDMTAQYGALLFRNLEGCIGEVSGALLILGGVVLIVKGIVDWRIPLGYVGTVALMSWLLRFRPHLQRPRGRGLARRVLHGHGLRHIADVPRRALRLRRGMRCVQYRDALLRAYARDDHVRHLVHERSRSADRQGIPAQDVRLGSRARGGEGRWLGGARRISR